MKIKVEFETRVPDEATQEQILEWLHYHLNASDNLSLDSPMGDNGIEAKPRSIDFRSIKG